MPPPAKRNDPDRKATRRDYLKEGAEITKEAERRAEEAERTAAEKKGGK
jgi:hypothetical protein